MSFKTGGFNGLVNRSRGSDQVLVIFTRAFFSQLPRSPELPFSQWLQPNQIKNRIYTAKLLMRLVDSQIDK